MKALLLVGPTGSGKSPLGSALQKSTGWYHFDFGDHLREIADGKNAHGLSDEEAACVKHLVDAHALFPRDKLSIVQKIFDHACAMHSKSQGIILNGMPRTIEQADALELNVTAVVELKCMPETVEQRVWRRRAGTTADHAGRSDDTSDALERKLEIYERWTRPVIDYYRARGVPVIGIPVAVDTAAEDILPELIDSMGDNA